MGSFSLDINGSFIDQLARQLAYVISLLACSLRTQARTDDQSNTTDSELVMLLINTNTNLTCTPPPTHTHKLRCVRHPKRNVLSRWFW